MVILYNFITLELLLPFCLVLEIYSLIWLLIYHLCELSTFKELEKFFTITLATLPSDN